MVNAPKKSSALIQQTNGKDLRNREGIATYTQHWDRDSSKDTAEMMEQRKDVYTDVVRVS